MFYNTEEFCSDIKRERFYTMNRYKRQSLIGYRDLLIELVTKDVKLKYRRSFLGYLWSILNPLMIMLVMVIVFSSIFRFDVENYPVYLIIGQTIYNYVNNATVHAIYSVTDNGALLKKVYVPKYIFPLSKVTSDLVDFLFSLGAMVLVMVITGTPFSVYFILLPYVAVQIYLFTLGMGMFLAQASVFFRDVRYIYNVFLTAWMYATPIFYPVTMLPDKIRWIVTHLNPLYYYIEQFRVIVLERTVPSMVLVSRGCIISLLFLGFGILTFRKSQDKFILYI